MESNTQRRQQAQQKKMKERHLKATKKHTVRKRLLCIVILGVVSYLMFFSKSSSWDVPSDPLAVKADDRVKWAHSGTVTLIEYLDFECEVCKANYPLMKQLTEEFSGDLQIVVRYFPMPGHRNATAAAYAVEAAWKQGKFRQMHDLLFERQAERGEREQEDKNIFMPYAQQIWLDMTQYASDIGSDAVVRRIARDKGQWAWLGVKGTPSFFLNGQRIQNPRSLDEFRTLIAAELLKNPRVARWEKVHEHADYKVFINNQEVSFSGDQYQSTTGKELSSEQHLHDNNGNNIHKHLTKKTIVDFFHSLWVTLTKDCIQIHTGTQYCTTTGSTLKFYVNDKPKDDFMNYEFRDLDRILISYGAETDEQLKSQLASVTDLACMYSAKCPERGKPPTENCVVGLGGDC
jgi:protein-disulfide isomerase